VRVLVLSSVYATPKLPNFGRMVRERIRRVGARADVVVVAPYPWFPMNRWTRGREWDGIPGLERRDGLTVHHRPFFSVPRFFKSLDGVLYFLSVFPLVRRLHRTHRFDLIDAHFAYPDGFVAALCGRLLGLPVMITLRGSIVRLASYRLHRPQLRFALASAAGVVAVSESLKEIAVSLGTAPDKVRVVPNGVDADLFRPLDQAEARRDLGLRPHGPILLSVGSLNEGKGHHRVLSVLPEVIMAKPDLLYVIAGGERRGDNYRPVLERLVERHGLHAQVKIVGERPHAELPRWLAAADVFCLATRSEGWSNAIMEALACGRPVVTTRVGGNPEIIDSDALGLLVPPEDDAALGPSIVAALERPWDREAIAAYARRYSWDAVADAVVEAWEGLAAGGTARAGPSRPMSRPAHRGPSVNTFRASGAPPHPIPLPLRGRGDRNDALSLSEAEVREGHPE
jgi:glycosyltransferase involved in cell wall biosynthesis